MFWAYHCEYAIIPIIIKKKTMTPIPHARRARGDIPENRLMDACFSWFYFKSVKNRGILPGIPPAMRESNGP